MLKYLLLLFSICTFSQEATFTFAPGSDVEGYPEIQEQNEVLGYEPIEDDTNDYSFRLSYNATAITVYKIDNSCFGNMTLNVYELGEFANEDTGKIFKMTFSLTQMEAKSILELIDKTQIDTIPTDKLIKEWRQGFDGVTYNLEYKKNAVYSLKSYWTPRSQPYVSEAVKIEDFTTRLFEILTASGYYETFNRLIPFRIYTNGSGTIVARVLTEKEYRAYKRRKKQYEKSHS